MEKFNKNLKNFLTIDSHFISSKNFVFGEKRFPGPPFLEPLLLSHVYMIFIIVLYIWLQNPPKSWGRIILTNFPLKSWGEGRLPPDPRQRTPWVPVQIYNLRSLCPPPPDFNASFRLCRQAISKAWVGNCPPKYFSSLTKLAQKFCNEINFTPQKK